MKILSIGNGAAHHPINFSRSKHATSDTVKQARKDYPQSGIKIGNTYYWWKFRYGSKVRSLSYPKRSQLTQSGFLSQLYELEDALSERLNNGRDDLSSTVTDIVSEIEELRDECQGSLDNMPEHLQDSSTSGELLNERIEALDGWINEIENIDVEKEEEEQLNNAIEELASTGSSL